MAPGLVAYQQQTRSFASSLRPSEVLVPTTSLSSSWRSYRDTEGEETTCFQSERVGLDFCGRRAVGEESRMGGEVVLDTREGGRLVVLRFLNGVYPHSSRHRPTSSLGSRTSNLPLLLPSLDLRYPPSSQNVVVCLEPKFVAPSLRSFSLSELTRSPSTVEFPPILAILLSPYATLLTSLISPSHHAFLSQLHQSTPSRLDRLALASFQTFQTYPSTLLALPRAALALMLVLGGTGKSFEALEVAEDGLYFMERGGEQELTLYASIVLSVFVGAVWVRVMVLLGAWVVVWRMDRKEGRCGEVEKASGELVVGKGWRGRLEERIQETFDACVAHPWPNNNTLTLRRSASSVRVSQLGRSPATTHHLTASAPPSRKPSPRPSNLRVVQTNPRRTSRTPRSPNSRFFVGRSQPTAFTPPLRSAPITDPSSSTSRGTTIVDRSMGTDSTLAFNLETNEDDGGAGSVDASRAPSWDSVQAPRRQQQPFFPPSPPTQTRTPPSSSTTFPPLPRPAPPPSRQPPSSTLPFNSPPPHPQFFSASTPPPPSSYLPSEDFFEQLQSEPVRPSSTAGGFSAPSPALPSGGLLNPRSSNEQERDRRTSTRTFGRPNNNGNHHYSSSITSNRSDLDPESPLLEPPTRGKFSAISRVDSTTSSVGEPSVANRTVMVMGRGMVVGGGREGGGGGDGTGGRERETLSIEVGGAGPHPRASTEPSGVAGRHRPSSLLVPASERTGRKSWSEPSS
ncbi:hypothetical protein BDY24DRAFT_440004 [Mrakia frigida]|uniref:uncharacterized protein n=1 Tax=Mrakia frigida TaxID=29902 RepID=UPI003FCC0FD7